MDHGGERDFIDESPSIFGMEVDMYLSLNTIDEAENERLRKEFAF
jgi:hypothetical protein